MSNIQVTHGASLNDARSESVVLINPGNPQQVVGASGMCKDIARWWRSIPPTAIVLR